MAILNVAEFNTMGGGSNFPAAVVQVPPIASQNVAIGGTSTPSNAFAPATTIVRIHTDVACAIAFGAAPTAVATGIVLAAGATEYFAVPAGQNYKVAVITP